MKAWILICSCLCLLWTGSMARADSSGQDPYFKAILKAEDGKTLLLFGNLSPDQAEKFFADAVKNKDAKDSEIELYESYRLSYKPTPANKNAIVFERIGQGFALSTFDIAIILDKAHASLANSTKPLTGAEAKEREREKPILVFYKKGLVPNSQSMESLIRTAEFVFWPEQASTLNY